LSKHAGPPQPPHPEQREKPLPSHEPKSSADDLRAPERVTALLASPSYREADQDPDFLHSPDARGMRLQLDFAKADAALARAGIDHTIAVFGSTRTCEPHAAQRQLRRAREALVAAPHDPALRQRVAIAERVEANSRYYDIAREFAHLVAALPPEPGKGTLTILTGGGPGIMEAANRGAHDAGARNVGLNITLPHEQYPNPYITPELCFRFHYFGIRKLHFLLRARALVAFPGGYGTFDELFETLALVQTRKMAPIPIVLVGAAYWQRAFDVDFLVGEGVIDPEDRELFWFAESAREIWDGILRWYALAGRSVVDGTSAIGAGNRRSE